MVGGLGLGHGGGLGLGHGGGIFREENNSCGHRPKTDKKARMAVYYSTHRILSRPEQERWM